MSYYSSLILRLVSEEARVVVEYEDKSRILFYFLVRPFFLAVVIPFWRVQIQNNI